MPICSPIWCGGCWRTAPIRPSSRWPPIRPCRSTIMLQRPQSWIADPEQRAIRIFRCRATCSRPARQNSAGVEFGDRAALAALLAEIDAAPPERNGRAADRRRRRGRPRARRALADRRQARSAPCRKATRRSSASAMAAAQAGFAGLGRDAGRRARRRARTRRRPDRAEPRPADRAAAERGRQDARRLRLGSARGRRFLPLLRRRGAPHARAAAAAGADRREQRTALSRPRRLRLHQPVEFPAGDFHRPGRRRARRRQCGGGQARRADAADRLRSGQAAARRRRAGKRAASGARRRRGRRHARRRQPRRRRRLHRLDRGRRASSTARSPPRTARSRR